MKTAVADGAIAPWTAERAAALQAIRMAALGFISETMPRGCCPGSTITATGDMHSSCMPLRKGDVVTSIVSAVQTLGSTLTLTKQGIYSLRTAALLATTADLSAAVGSTGLKISPLTALFTAPDDDLYVFTHLCVGTTPPVMVRGGLTFGMVGALQTGFPVEFGRQTSLADLPATHALVATASAINPWFAAV